MVADRMHGRTPEQVGRDYGSDIRFLVPRPWVGRRFTRSRDLDSGLAVQLSVGTPQKLDRPSEVLGELSLNDDEEGMGLVCKVDWLV